MHSMPKLPFMSLAPQPVAAPALVHLTGLSNTNNLPRSVPRSAARSINGSANGVLLGDLEVLELVRSVLTHDDASVRSDGGSRKRHERASFAAHLTCCSLTWVSTLTHADP